MKDLTEEYEGKTYATRGEAEDEVKRIVDILDDPDNHWFSNQFNYVIVVTSEGRFIPMTIPQGQMIKHWS